MFAAHASAALWGAKTHPTQSSGGVCLFLSLSPRVVHRTASGERARLSESCSTCVKRVASTAYRRIQGQLDGPPQAVCTNTAVGRNNREGRCHAGVTIVPEDALRAGLFSRSCQLDGPKASWGELALEGEVKEEELQACAAEPPALSA
eukprot:354574-Chlamydomonas_euryale.AAC.13